MRNWIVFIFLIDERLDNLCKILDKRIERRAVNLVLPIERLIDEIYQLNDFKMRLINLRVLHRYISRHLNRDELDEIKKAIRVKLKGCKAYGDWTSRTTMYRHRNKVLDKCIALAGELGFNEERLENEYPSYKKLINKLFR